MKKRMIYKVAALALIMGGLGITNINLSQASSPNTPPVHCMFKHRECISSCYYNVQIGPDRNECLEGCDEELDECLGT